MKLRLYKLTFILVLFLNFSINSQTDGESKYLEMKNCFVLGLSEKGLEIAIELLSRPEYADVKEETVFYIAEFFFVVGLGAKEIDIHNLNKAYTYYKVYNHDYPNSVYTDVVNKRLHTLESYYGDWITFRNLYDIIENEALIVEKKLSFATKKLFWFSNPNLFKFFSYTESEQSSIELLDRYFDEIIVNHPDFEVYAYYYKILARFSKIRGRSLVKEGLLDLNVDKFQLHLNVEELTDKGFKFRIELEEMLRPLSEKHPNHPLVLNLHLIYANYFKLIDDEKFDSYTKKHLEFVVQNEPDKTHPRYLMAKEFLLSNKFQ
ncbi:MAG: hypothetical protein IH852_04360 [Bacteroidetes bacterium]|nr:hypothetical protein [Bacteroidota bacterium]